MRRKAIASALFSACLCSVALTSAVFAESTTGTVSSGYDPMTTPAPMVANAERAALIGLDELNGKRVAVGSFGTLLIQNNDGEWQQAEIPTSVLLTSVDQVSDSIIWAAGHEGIMLQSTDGGVSWQRRMDGHQLLAMEYPYLEQRAQMLENAIDNAEDEYEAEELSFALDELGFLMQGAEIQFEVGPTKPFLDIRFLNENIGFALAAYGTLLRTENGGDDWEIISHRIENPMGYHLNRLVVNDNNEVVLVGEYGLLARSTDLGENWETLESPYDGSWFGGLVDNNGRLWVYGLRGNVFVSNDFGDSFEHVQTPTRYNLNNGTVLENGHVAIVGHSGVIVVVNPATYESVLYTHESSTPLTAIRQLGQNHFLLTGRSGVLEFHVPVAASGTEG
ncbi:WD40/YVTN/BNR-like repeat-containing protein [Aliidiomarina celeris]|uniref:WD40/YVTN/BNR-like repeat-containing protein n=1 Tax=Aliidiomarina celeris TaxID=2249428 RepID=UPI00130083A8|nr:YCF48-related protein [Aliidiomarina celeris]